jgi:hypothetical protein
MRQPDEWPLTHPDSPAPRCDQRNAESWIFRWSDSLALASHNRDSITGIVVEAGLIGLQQAPPTVVPRQFPAEDLPGRPAPGSRMGPGVVLNVLWSRRLRRRRQLQVAGAD